MTPDAERERLEQDRLGLAAWKRWGPYLSDRAWGTVREDYSATGEAWRYFPHDHARSRAYRWNEDGLLGISDHNGRLCLALALWNGHDPIIKERLFGLTGEEGNHGEDVKENYFYLESTPTHSYMKALYKYPQLEFPYAKLVEENKRRGKLEPEFELLDTGVFSENKYWDVVVEYAKQGAEDVLMRITAYNRGSETARLHVLPTLWYRNRWSWGRVGIERSNIRPASSNSLFTEHPDFGARWLYVENDPEMLFCENETNLERLYGVPNQSHAVKDGINDHVVHGKPEAISHMDGSKAALWHQLEVEAGASKTVRVRFSNTKLEQAFSDFDLIFTQRKLECDQFYAKLETPNCSPDEKLVQRQAFAGMLWSKQFYHFDIKLWLDGDPGQPAPPEARKFGRNKDWETLNNHDVISMPDKWEYPWYAAWDLAFHTIPFALLDPEFAKHQLEHLTREWYQHPNGQLPAYEWAFGDVNPPVHAWATWRVYKIEQKHTGRSDRAFLERVFHKLLLNFTWWVNRKDASGRNVFQGGFLGLDNISVFDRSQPLPGGGQLEQADGTAWMGMYALNMLKIALELARENPVYEDIATKFFEHFLYIAKALNTLGLWDETDEFYYDALRTPDGKLDRLEVRSMVGLIPLLAVETLNAEDLQRFPNFNARLNWFLQNRPDLASLVSRWMEMGGHDQHLLALARGHRMKRVLARMLDETEFLSQYGIRALSRYHLAQPFELRADGQTFRIGYEPAESSSGLFGGNSNWRGPIWFPINYLLIESLQKFHHYYTEEFKLECPTGSGQYMTLQEVANELSKRLIGIFTKDANGKRAVFGANSSFQNDPNWHDLIPFHEYFHGDNGAGIGASHQTGWTGLVAKLIHQQGLGKKEAELEESAV
jgi:hypothetical protein